MLISTIKAVVFKGSLYIKLKDCPIPEIINIIIKVEYLALYCKYIKIF